MGQMHSVRDHAAVSAGGAWSVRQFKPVRVRWSGGSARRVHPATKMATTTRGSAYFKSRSFGAAWWAVFFLSGLDLTHKDGAIEHGSGLKVRQNEQKYGALHAALAPAPEHC